MAKLEGIESGLVPWTPPAPKKKKAPAEEECKCPVCRGVFNKADVKWGGERCLHCIKFFGGEDHFFGEQRGVTSLRPKHALERITAIREAQWALILRRGSFGTPAGQTVTVEPGDIFKVTRAGAELNPEQRYCCWERTRNMFSVEVNIVGTPLTLWPHEVAEIGFATVMALKSSGEIVEAFLSTGDSEGHFRPTEELREAIYSAYGPLVGA